MRYLILDIATAPLPDAATYLEGAVKAPSNYKDEAKIAAYIAEAEAERLAMAATDLDLACITAIGWQAPHEPMKVRLFRTEAEEHEGLNALAVLIDHQRPTLVTFGGFFFDLPMLMRRARYLGMTFPVLNLDKYRSPHVDLCDVLSDRDPKRKRSLGFYAKRLGWTDLHKPLSGAEESRVMQTGQWDALRASLEHDLTATYRLAQWAGVVPVAATEAVAEPVL